MSMRATTRNEGTTINNYNNEVTEAIDSQTIMAPQFGVVGNPPEYDPPPQPQGKRKNRFMRSKQRFERRKSTGPSVRSMRTKELKLYIALLEAELALVESKQLDVNGKVRDAMERRLALMQQEKTRRDLHDLAKGKHAPTRSFYSIGALVATKAA